MSIPFHKHAVLISSDSIFDAIRNIEATTVSGGESGIAVIIDERFHVLGVVTDGDIRHAICQGRDLMDPVASIMTLDPICISANLDQKTALQNSLKKMKSKGIKTEKIIVVNELNCFVDIINIRDLLINSANLTPKKIRVFGQGFVGLTLAVTLAEVPSFEVEGIDTDELVLASLRKGLPHFHEKNLANLLASLVEKEKIIFEHADHINDSADVHIISVGTPLDKDGRPDRSFLEKCIRSIGAHLKKDNLVICRSTVPVGTCRNYIIPALESYSGMSVGVDFHFAFCPERTVEGDALNELRSLPQIVGGASVSCQTEAAAIFQKITSTLIYVDSLEAAELVKLINNTYRDLVFSFANEVAYISDAYNIDAFELIAAANDGYPRNPIPKPGPGVGGICLSKDPILYGVHESVDLFSPARLGVTSRSINELGARYAMWQLDKYLLKNPHLAKSKLKVMVVGIAFKGFPETSDMRFSYSVELISALREKGYSVCVFDAVIPRQNLQDLGVEVVDSIEEGLIGLDAIFFMNNHPKNAEFDVAVAARLMNSSPLFFDGWKLFKKEHILTFGKFFYSTMGFMVNSTDA
jgi:UDP-N-acetyl-D-mannosaminuronic acid dehydrogenase